MAQPPILSSPVKSPGPQGPETLSLVAAVLVVAVFLFVAGVVLSGGPVVGSSPWSVAPLCGVVLIMILVVALAFAGATRRRALPPPPLIQQPMVPAGTQGVVELACPNCGAPPTNVDRFGVATCGYCNTRFLVR